MQRNIRAFWLLFAACVLLGACGWHPRGAQEVPPELRQLRLQSQPPDGEFAHKLGRALKGAGVELVDTAGGYSLHTGKEQRVSRNVALDPGARSAEQEMRLTVAFELRDASGDLVLGPRELSAGRVYAYDPNSVIAKQDEEKLIYSELQDNVVGQIFRQLRRVDLSARQPAAK